MALAIGDQEKRQPSTRNDRGGEGGGREGKRNTRELRPPVSSYVTFLLRYPC